MWVCLLLVDPQSGSPFRFPLNKPRATSKHISVALVFPLEDHERAGRCENPTWKQGGNPRNMHVLCG